MTKSFLQKSGMILTSLVVAASCARAADDITLTVQAGDPGPAINPSMWGIFFEDINFGADGGLYSQLVKDGSFEFTNGMIGWSKSGNGTAEIRTENPFDAANPHYLRLVSDGSGAFGVANEGFRGMGIKSGEAYDFSAQIRVTDGTPALNVELTGADGKSLGSAKLEGFSGEWKKYSTTLHATGTDAKAKLSIALDGKGTVDLDMASLFPQKTWKNRPGGLRADMVQLLADLKPGFMRFPGGCIVEGSQLDRRYQWKTTIGPIEDRKLIINRWNYEFKHRPTPDYFESFGLGFFEFFQLCEDIGASPLPILNCGMACQFNTGQLVPLTDLDTYIQDALDLIEFANGPVTSEWGAKRAAMGHPAPFNMKMMGVGNEQWGPQYVERYEMFAKVLKAKHPEIMLVSSAGPSPADDRFNFLWPEMRKEHADIVDEHCYARPIWFFNNVNRYDKYDRKGPKVFMGEYAAQSDTIVSVNNRNNWECALAEAAYMTGLERNADVVRMASYAPLFANVDAWQWTPNLIWVDSLQAYGTPNYYVQQLFSLNRGDFILPTRFDMTPPPTTAPSGGIALGTFKTTAEFKDIHVTQGNRTVYAADFTSSAGGWKTSGGRWTVKDGAYQQLDDQATPTATTGDPKWHDYTLTLKARKLSGAEGFIIGVRNQEPGTLIQWNLGGWGNTQFGIQSLLGVQEKVIARTPGRIEPNRWYDIRIELSGSRVRCYLDDKLVQAVDVPGPKPPSVYASAVRDQMAGEVILKLVNATPQVKDIDVRLDGIKRVKPGAKQIVLAGASLDDMNSFAEPKKVAPRQSASPIVSPRFKQTVPAQTMMVLRVPVE